MKLEYVISTITLDSVKARTVECMEAARWKLSAEGMTWYWNTPYGDGKARARSIAASRFLTQTPDAQCLLFIDSDILFTPGNIKRLFEDMKAGYDLIGGLFVVRGGTQSSSYGYNGKIILDGKIHEFEYIASGFMGISRKLLLKMVNEIPLLLLHPRDIKFYPFFEEKQYPEREGEGIFLSEDYDFCEKARKVGVKCYMDTSIQLGHMGEYIFSLNDMLRLQEENKSKEVVENQQRLKNLRQDVADYTNQPIEEVDRKLMNTQMSLAKMWREHTGSTYDFYDNNQECLYDDANFNMSEEYARLRLAQLTKLMGQRILDYGCGIGTASIMLAEQGNEVIGYDINPYIIDFCNFKKKKYELKVDFTTKLPDLKQFDTIVCIDVLEHIQNLEGFLQKLGKEMKKNAVLYHFDSFGEDPTHPQHFDHSAHIADYFKQAGFGIKSENWAIVI